MESIINQIYPVYKILIQDDCSSDFTVEILKGYSEKYQRIHCDQNETKLGCNSKFRKAIYREKGEFISISDQDDIWFFDKVEKLIKNISNYKMIVSDSKFFGMSEGLRYSSIPDLSSVLC